MNHATHSLIAGYGSIGRRHARHLTELGSKVSLLTSQMVNQYPCFTTLEEAFRKNSFDHIIIANPTHLHQMILQQLQACHYQGTILVEKPLYATIHSLPEQLPSKILVAYNLRFHTLLLAAKELLNNEDLISFSAHVGQYLPSWRPGRDYRHTYSAKKAEGGGVLRDLSHEIDYCLWFCGNCLAVTALGGQYSELEIDSDDAYTVIMRTQKCPMVSLQLNYLYRTPKREILIQTRQHTILIDLIKGMLIMDGEIRLQTPNETKQTYYKQIKALIEGDFMAFTSYEQGIEVIRLIEAIEDANQQQHWINL